MYLQFFGLKQEPFSIAPDPRFLFMSERHREALAHLRYGLQSSGGFVVLSGEIGAGKTTVCRCLLEQLPQHCTVAYLFNPKLTVRELLQAICADFGIPNPREEANTASIKDYIDALNAFLLKSHAAGLHNVLIIDEAQNLAPAVLEQLRLLTNLETHERKLLQIMLIGQPELREMLARPDLKQLAQRVVARFHLGALSAAETEAYIRHRLGVAGMGATIPFDRESLRRIHELSQGVPRRINLLCDRALLGAYAQGMVRVRRAMVDRAAQEVFGNEATTGLARWLVPEPRRRWLGMAATALAASAVGAIGTAAWWQWGPRSAAPSRAPAATAAPAASVPGASVASATSAAPVPAASGAVAAASAVLAPSASVASASAASAASAARPPARPASAR